MKFDLYRRPYNVGTSWRKWRTVEAENYIAALKTTEFKNEKIQISQFDKRVGVLGGVSEFIALSHEEIEGWDGYLIPPVK
jgi:hypothetical protein